MDWLLTAIISSCIAAFVIVLVSFLVDRCGGRIAGVLGTVPHVAVVGTVAFEASLNLHEFKVATFSMCFGMFFSAVYLAIVVLASRIVSTGRREQQGDAEDAAKTAVDDSVLSSGRYRMLIIVSSGLAAYSILVAAVLAILRPKERSAEQVRGLAVAALCLQCMVGLALVWCCPSSPRAKSRSPVWHFGARGIVTFALFMSAMAVSKTVPALAGILVNLPLVTTVVLVTVWLSHGETVALGTCGPMALGIMSASSYALTAGHLIPVAGPAVGASISWLLCVALVTLPVLGGLEALSRHRRAEPRPSSEDVPAASFDLEVPSAETNAPQA